MLLCVANPLLYGKYGWRGLVKLQSIGALKFGFMTALTSCIGNRVVTQSEGIENGFIWRAAALTAVYPLAPWHVEA